MPKQPKDHVKKHLEKNGVDPAKLSDGTIEALNSFSDPELAKLDALGGQLQGDQTLTPAMKISAVH